MTRSYLDFDLQIDELDATTFRARVLDSPAGNAEVIFKLPFSDLEVDNFLLRISRPRRGVRRINSPEMNETRMFGSKLYNALFQASLQACLLRSIDQAEQQNCGLRLRLRLPPSLMELPWEYLYDTDQDRFLSHSTGTPIVRYLALAEALQPLHVAPPLLVLVMIANPRDNEYESLDVEAEWQKIESAVGELKARGLIELTRLPDATLGTLQKQLRRNQYHIFHFVGHGGFDQQTQDGVLLLESENGHSRLVSGNTLGTLLHDHSSLRLALLNACEGARTTRADAFAGVAQQLVKQGIPAVIAMQFEITDRAAIQLAHEFYGALADSYPVDGALAEARKAIFAAGNDVEWGTPVLYMRSEDGQLFDLTTQVGNTSPSTSKTSEATDPSSQSAKEPALDNTTTVLNPRRKQRWFAIGTVAVLLMIASIWTWQANKPSVSNPTPSVQTSPSLAVTSTAPDTTEVPQASQMSDPILVVIDPISRTLWLKEGTVALDAENYGQARAAFEKVLTANPNDIEALLGLADALRWSGEWDQALVTLSQAVNLEPDNPNVNLALGMLLRETFSRSEDAIEPLSKAIEHGTPALLERVYAERAATYQDLKQYEQSIADCNEVIRIDPSSDSYSFRAQVYQAWGKQELAEEDYSAAIAQSPSTGKYYLARADFYAQANQVEQAVADYESFLRLHDPEEDQGLLDKAESYIRLHSSTPTSALPPTPAAGTRMTNSVDGAVYVYVPAGDFIMGSNDGNDDEKPVHKVTLDAFWIMQTEVTNTEYKKCVNAEICSKPNHADWDEPEFWAKFAQHPVVYVTWNQANTYSQWAGGRLPTEAEWEKAARGPNGNPYPWGSEPPNVELLNFDNRTGTTTEAGHYAKGKSYFGAYDLAGNVWEWIADWYGLGYYSTSPTVNPKGPATGPYHVLRGGSYVGGSDDVRSSRRGWDLFYDGHGGSGVGFRVVRLVSLEKLQ